MAVVIASGLSERALVVLKGIDRAGHPLLSTFCYASLTMVNISAIGTNEIFADRTQRQWLCC
jgi:hypothetical protein